MQLPRTCERLNAITQHQKLIEPACAIRVKNSYKLTDKKFIALSSYAAVSVLFHGFFLYNRP